MVTMQETTTSLTYSRPEERVSPSGSGSSVLTVSGVSLGAGVVAVMAVAADYCGEEAREEMIRDEVGVGEMK